MDFSQLNTFIRQKAGLSLSSRQTDGVEREIQGRMNEKNIVSLSDYLTLLKRDKNEFHFFINLMTVNETYFFREPAYIRLFVERLAPELKDLSLSGGPPLKILSAGCSTGEEPYSLLMALMDRFGARVRESVVIRGIDIDARAIEKGSIGIYAGQSFRSMDKGILHRYFDEIGRGRFQLKEKVRSGVQLETVNLLDFPYPRSLTDMDIIFYRNVSIYFPKTVQRQIFEQMTRLLKPGGCLIVGAAETLSHHYRLLTLVEMDDLFFFRKQPDASTPPSNVEEERWMPKRPAAPQKQALSPPVSFKSAHRPKDAPVEKKEAPQRVAPAAEERDRSEKMHSEALALAKQKMYTQALAVLEQPGRECPLVRCKLLKALILMNLKRLDESERLCREAVASDPLLMEGHLLLGIIIKLLRADDKTAVKSFKTVLYLSSTNWVAHYHLAEIYQQNNQDASAIREYQNVIRLLEKGHFNEHGLSFFPFSFSEVSVMHLCRHHIRGLKNRGGDKTRGKAYGV